MSDRNFRPNSEPNGLLHPPSCACVKCAAGRESQELSFELLERVKNTLDDAFLKVVEGNFLMSCQALGQGGSIDVVRSNYIASMGKAMQAREMAAAYFATQEPGKD